MQDGNIFNHVCMLVCLSICLETQKLLNILMYVPNVLPLGIPCPYLDQVPKLTKSGEYVWLAKNSRVHREFAGSGALTKGPCWHSSCILFLIWHFPWSNCLQSVYNVTIFYTCTFCIPSLISSLKMLFVMHPFHIYVLISYSINLITLSRISYNLCFAFFPQSWGQLSASNKKDWNVRMCVQRP